VIGSVAKVVAGPQPNAGYAARALLDSNCSLLPYLADLKAFAEISADNLIALRFPDDFQSGAGALGLGRRKVIVPAVSGPDTPWRLRTGLDLSGVLARNSMLMVIPDLDDDPFLYGLHAYLGSAFASCWIDEIAVERNVSTTEVAGIPVPSGRKAWRALAALGRGLARTANSPRELQRVSVDLDDLVWDLLDIPLAIRQKTRRKLADFPAPEKQFRYTFHEQATESAAPTGPVRSRIGVVEGIRDGMVLIQVPGVTPDEGVWLEPPAAMPSGLCREGATFDVSIADNMPLELGSFRYQRESWVDDVSLFGQPPWLD
jgi:hypothetical protein